MINQEGGMLGINQLPQFTAAIVAKPTTIIKVKVSTFICLLSYHPEWMLSFLQEMGAKFHHFTEQLSTMTFLTVEKRICYTLLMLSQDTGFSFFKRQYDMEHINAQPL
ncbi:hypothetical protein [Neobacillus cucumis]|uniref:hypothetical protein n=1 Tax=Neobacillus cucumis TaxID=1740721 RepID=UPI002E1E8A1A|nr:hypothetical protein [Neobacillus cucumis]